MASDPSLFEDICLMVCEIPALVFGQGYASPVIPFVYT